MARERRFHPWGPIHVSCHVRRAVHFAHAPRCARGAVVSGSVSNPGTPRPAPTPPRVLTTPART
eukprot:scaffold40781_cov60-Phaeocystis_antarctica.AAC.1